MENIESEKIISEIKTTLSKSENTSASENFDKISLNQAQENSYKIIFDNIGQLGICVISLILLAIGCAWLLSLLGKLKGTVQRTIVIEVGMQNAAQAIAVATSPFIFNSQEIAIPAIIYSLLMNLVLLPYVAIVRRKKIKE